MNQDSPFETWRLANLKQVAVSPEILELLARAYEGGFIDGMQKQMQSSVDRAVNAMTQPTYFIPSKEDRTWVGGLPMEQPAQQEPVDFASLLREAEEIVQGKPTWKRFIAGTPLANDVAVWMTVFAQDFARRASPQPAQRTWVDLPLEETDAIIDMFTGDPWTAVEEIKARLKKKNT